ncbi:MAG: NUDIX hydrolase [Legionellales bacterium]|nr:NUDIX hydrolase [Legionellales bacterium]
MNQVNIYQEKPRDFNSQVSIATCWIKYQDEILFLQRSKESKSALLWAVPGGKIENTETPLEGMIREIQEETSISLNRKEILDLGYFYIRTPEWQYTYYMFFIELTNQPIVNISDEHNDFKWVTLLDSWRLPLMVGVKETIEIFNTKINNL